MNTTIPAEQLIQQLQWRYATKQFDPRRKISDRDWAALEDAIQLSASSFGLQPYQFIVVRNPAVRAKLRAAAFAQAQVEEASHLVVFAARTNLDQSSVDAYMARISQVRGVPAEKLAGFRDMLYGFINRLDAPARTAWARNQAYIALGNLLTSAALLGIDAGPMEGFDAAQFDEILGLRGKGLTSAVIAAVGYRLSADPYAALPKVRFPKHELFARI